MPRSSTRRRRARGAIEELPSGALRVKVYAGIDPVSKSRRYLTETVKAAPGAGTEAERVLSRLLNQVDEKRNPRTTATLNQLLDRWLEVLDVEVSTRRGYLTKINKHVRPLLGNVQVARIDAEALDSFYAELRKCRDHCGGRRGHDCKPLSDSSIRAIHWILSGAFQRAVRWRWLATNPADHAEPPPMSRPNPQPPSVEEAARLVDEAFARHVDWGTLVWVAMTTGARRGELCALRWSNVDLDSGVISFERALYVDEDGELAEKDTKTHQQRRVVLDPETLAVLKDHLALCGDRADAAQIPLPSDSYVFSLKPEGSQPLVPDSVTQRYDRMAKSLGIKTTLHKLRHYSATELINAGVDIRTIAGRLGHGGGGATTLRVYTAWLSEADQRAAKNLAVRLPARRLAYAQDAYPKPGRATPRGPYEQIASDIRGAIRFGAMRPGDQLPPVKEIATQYRVAASTAQRALAVLADESLIQVSRGKRAIVSPELPTRSDVAGAPDCL
jgi:integrase